MAHPWGEIVGQFFYKTKQGFLVAQMVENLPTVQETQVQFLGWEDPLEEGVAVHSGILAWRISMDRGTWWVTVMGSQSQTQLSD